MLSIYDPQELVSKRLCSYVGARNIYIYPRILMPDNHLEEKFEFLESSKHLIINLSGLESLSLFTGALRKLVHNKIDTLTIISTSDIRPLLLFGDDEETKVSVEKLNARSLAWCKPEDTDCFFARVNSLVKTYGLTK